MADLRISPTFSFRAAIEVVKGQLTPTGVLSEHYGARTVAATFSQGRVNSYLNMEQEKLSLLALIPH